MCLTFFEVHAPELHRVNTSPGPRPKKFRREKTDDKGLEPGALKLKHSTTLGNRASVAVGSPAACRYSDTTLHIVERCIFHEATRVLSRGLNHAGWCLYAPFTTRRASATTPRSANLLVIRIFAMLSPPPTHPGSPADGGDPCQKMHRIITCSRTQGPAFRVSG